MAWPKTIKIYTDGASRGNPGPASVGVSFVTMEDEEFDTISEVLGEKTNNFAEYTALIMALKKALENKVENVWVRTDSQLMVKQLKGEYSVKAEQIKELYQNAFGLLKKFKKVKLEHVLRTENKRADELANYALDHKWDSSGSLDALKSSLFDDEF